MRGTARGTLSEEEVQAYGGAMIDLLDNTNDMTGSGTSGTASGSGTYEWTLSWDSQGFTGYGWYAWDFDYSAAYNDGSISTLLNGTSEGYYVANDLSGHRNYVTAGCASLVHY